MVNEVNTMNIMLKYFIRFTAIAALFVIFTSMPAFGQPPEFFEPKNYEGFDFDYTYFIIPQKSGSNSALQVFTKIAFNRLKFKQIGNDYYAEYEITLELRDKDQDIKQAKKWREEFSTNDLSETKSNSAYHISRAQLASMPGKYSLDILIEDLQSNTTIKKSFPVTIYQNSQNETRITNILFVQDVLLNNEQLADYIPSIGEILEKTPNNYAFCEIINPKPDNKYSIETEIKVLHLKKHRVVYKNKTEKTSTTSTLPIITDISSLNLSSGSYEISYKITSGWKNDKTIAKNFYIAWSENPTNEEELDIALDQMKYAFDIVRYQNIKKMTYAEKYQLYNTIWSNRDPSPGTPINEFKDEYFRRVRYANANFSLFQEGWKTDRGMIYILFGPPTEIIRQEYDSTPILDAEFNTLYRYTVPYPMQHWWYMTKNILFSFHDRFGMGDYRLLVPYNYDPWINPIK